MAGQGKKPDGNGNDGATAETAVAKIKAKHKNIPASVLKDVDDKKDDKETRKLAAEKLLAWMRGNGRKA